MWVADARDAKLYAYNMDTKERDESKDSLPTRYPRCRRQQSSDRYMVGWVYHVGRGLGRQQDLRIHPPPRERNACFNASANRFMNADGSGVTLLTSPVYTDI